MPPLVLFAVAALILVIAGWMSQSDKRTVRISSVPVAFAGLFAILFGYDALQEGARLEGRGLTLSLSDLDENVTYIVQGTTSHPSSHPGRGKLSKVVDISTFTSPEDEIPTSWTVGLVEHQTALPDTFTIVKQHDRLRLVPGTPRDVTNENEDEY